MKEFSPINTFSRSTFFHKQMGTLNFPFFILVTPFDFLIKSLANFTDWILVAKQFFLVAMAVATLADCSQYSLVRTTVLLNERFLSTFCLQINKQWADRVIINCWSEQMVEATEAASVYLSPFLCEQKVKIGWTFKFTKKAGGGGGGVNM